MAHTARHSVASAFNVLIVAQVAMLCGVVAQAADLKFDFGSGQAQPGFTKVPPQSAYSDAQGFGFVRVAEPGKPAVFGVKVNEGNYDVTIRLGDPGRATSTTIKAETRRLMLEKVETAAGKYETRTFTVNVRTPAIPGGGNVSLKPGEDASANWDDRLTLEFNGSSPAVASIEIKPSTNALTVFIAGDSTVTDQIGEPFAGWGQMLPRFFEAGVAVSNHAWSGLTLTTFDRQKRLEKVLSMMKPGDYVFVQFGHNDQKEKDGGPFTTYKSNLKKYVEAVRGKGGIPVLVTSMERRRFDKDGKVTPTLADYAEAVRQEGAEDKVPVIDLNAMSLKFYAAMGADNSTKAFAFYPADSFPGQSKELKDNTHHNDYGAYELARCVVQGIKEKIPQLASHLTADAGNFDPANPDSPEKVAIPISPPMDKIEKPEGN